VSRLRSFFALGLVIGLLIGIVATGAVDIGVRAQDATPSSESSAALTGEQSAVEVVEHVAPAVVTVINEQTSQGIFGGSGSLQPAGSGTGFIIDDQGHVVTNWHVVEGGEQFQVIFSTGEERDATLVGSDELSDLAVVKIDGDIPGTVPFGDSDALKPGQTVLAIGSPLGAFANTVTQGIVSATNRDFPDQDQSTTTQYTNLIQHDAAINPGNSGGPLFNMSGEVVGVNTLGIPVENGQPVQGLFFAIPSNTVSRIAQDLIDDGSVTYPFFGISFADLNPQIAAQEGLSVDYGAYVLEVTEGGPADDAGIEAEDIVLSIAGQNIDAQNTFSEILFSHQPGETVDVVILRGDEQQTVQVTLANRDESI
jgi:S1-C subfamily serine protease